MGMAAGRAAAAAALLLLLAGGAYADCYNDCFNDCMGKFKNMRDYCSYACDKVCSPDADADDATLHQRRPPLAVVGPAASADHHPFHEKQQDADAAVWPAAALPDHPFHETHGGAVDVEPAGEPDPGHVVPPPRVPVLGAVEPAGEPDPGHVVPPPRVPHGAVEPAGEPDPGHVVPPPRVPVLP